MLSCSFLRAKRHLEDGRDHGYGEFSDRAGGYSGIQIFMFDRAIINGLSILGARLLICVQSSLRTGSDLERQARRQRWWRTCHLLFADY